MKELTIKKLLNKALEFNLYKLKKYALSLLVIAGLYGLYIVSVEIKPHYDEYMAERQVAFEISENNRRINDAKACEVSVISKGIKESTLQYHIELHTCYYHSQGLNITPEYIKHIKDQWDKNPDDIRMYLEL
ncbi:hypothetical protein [Moritella viscosa]|uniref:Cation efflux system protein CzcA n=1 Tax=Moritella viscosa TaxID=80854 RepID=A0A1L0ATK0_9GAMM|nr:hypothetical protein [Moritella viscosa]SGZ20857.1 Cation efflux system protein CzcA [Moritella viscosa]SHO28534.1 Cation efflux system protein CzcA [Moritella viscosa]